MDASLNIVGGSLMNSEHASKKGSYLKPNQRYSKDLSRGEGSIMIDN